MKSSLSLPATGKIIALSALLILLQDPGSAQILADHNENASIHKGLSKKLQGMQVQVSTKLTERLDEKLKARLTERLNESLDAQPAAEPQPAPELLTFNRFGTLYDNVVRARLQHDG